MTTEIAHLPATAMTEADIPLVGMEDYTGEEFRIPRINIIQTTKQVTEWSGMPGQFHNSLTGENHKTLDAVVLAVKKNRWLGPSFDEAEALRESGQEVVAYCKSSNGNMPDSDIAAPKCQACKLCDHGSPTKTATGWEAGDCTEIRKVLLALPDGSIGMLTVRNKATKDVDAYVQRFHMSKKNLFTLRVTIATKEEKGKTTYYLPTFTLRPGDAVPPEEQARYFEAIGLFAEMMKATSRDTHGEEVVEAPRGAGSHIDTTATPAAQAAPAATVLPNEIPDEAEAGF